MSREPSAFTELVVFGIKVACGVIIAICTVFTLITVGPAIETHMFPVVSKLRITQVSPDVDGNSLVYAEFTKLRNCEYVGISWFHGDPAGEFERVPVILLRKEGDTSSPNRPVGTQKAGPWIIAIPPEEVRSHSFAKLSHRCNPFWLTTTDFWP